MADPLSAPVAVPAPAHLHDAFARWLDALHHATDEARLLAAVTEHVRVERHEPAPRGVRGAVVAALVGLPAVSAWLRLTPAGFRFALAGPPIADGDAARAEYTCQQGEFRNGGLWIARLRDGRIASLAHRPFALPSP